MKIAKIVFYIFFIINCIVLDPVQATQAVANQKPVVCLHLFPLKDAQQSPESDLNAFRVAFNEWANENGFEVKYTNDDTALKVAVFMSGGRPMYDPDAINVCISLMKVPVPPPAKLIAKKTPTQIDIKAAETLEAFEFIKNEICRSKNIVLIPNVVNLTAAITSSSVHQQANTETQTIQQFPVQQVSTEVQTMSPGVVPVVTQIQQTQTIQDSSVIKKREFDAFKISVAQQRKYKKQLLGVGCAAVTLQRIYAWITAEKKLLAQQIAAISSNQLLSYDEQEKQIAELKSRSLLSLIMKKKIPEMVALAGLYGAGYYLVS